MSMSSREEKIENDEESKRTDDDATAPAAAAAAATTQVSRPACLSAFPTEKGVRPSFLNDEQHF